jgi:hypothetical protein
VEHEQTKLYNNFLEIAQADWAAALVMVPLFCICCANDAHGSRRCAAALRAVPRVHTLRFGRLRPSREMDRFKQVSLERPNWRISSGDFRRHLQSHDRAETG